MKAKIESNHYKTVREIALRLISSHTTIKNHIKRLELVKKFDIWVSHELREINLKAISRTVL